MSQFNRRQLLQTAALGALGVASSRWLPAFANAIGPEPSRRRHCILLWMAGGPTQTDTFDMKPGNSNGGEFKEIETNVPGLKFSEHLPKLAQHADQLAIVRGLTTQEGDHGRGTYLMRTGYRPLGPLRYPTLGSSLSKELGDETADVPNYISVNPFMAFNRSAFGPGFLGPKYAPLVVGEADNFNVPMPPAEGYAEIRVDDLRRPGGISAGQASGRLELWNTLQQNFLAKHDRAVPRAHDTVYRRALKMMDSDSVRAFSLNEETDTVRDAYGRGPFGQACLLARRLVERGVPFIEVTLPGWDTHADNFTAVKGLSSILDSGWGSLMTDLKDRGLLEQTTLVWMGEFGRTPEINNNSGRDHFPAAWTCVLGGGGIKGGQAYGKTSDDGTEVVDGKVGVGDVLATVCQALGVNPDRENISSNARPVKLAEGSPVEALLA